MMLHCAAAVILLCYTDRVLNEAVIMEKLNYSYPPEGSDLVYPSFGLLLIQCEELSSVPFSLNIPLALKDLLMRMTSKQWVLSALMQFL